MLKRLELSQTNSCLNKARDDEMLFVLLERDAATPAAIRAWVAERVRLGKNSPTDKKILEALATASSIALWHAKRGDAAGAEEAAPPTRYKLVRGDTIPGLEGAVSAAMAGGWEPHGSVQAVVETTGRGEDRYEEEFYVQAMTRPRTTIEELRRDMENAATEAGRRMAESLRVPAGMMGEAPPPPMGCVESEPEGNQPKKQVYTIATRAGGNAVAELSKYINYLADQGWRPVGGVSAAHRGDTWELVAAQLMVREE